MNKIKDMWNNLNKKGRTFAVGGYDQYGPGYFFIYESPTGD